jgi:hypothetical protein
MLPNDHDRSFRRIDGVKRLAVGTRGKSPQFRIVDFKRRLIQTVNPATGVRDKKGSARAPESPAALKPDHRAGIEIYPAA